MIGEKIKEKRLLLGYSAEQVAAFLNVSPATVYRYENGDISKMPAKYVKPLAEFLCTSPAELMGWDSSETQNKYTDDERRLITAYRGADDRAREDAMKMLLDHQKQDTASGQTA